MSNHAKLEHPSLQEYKWLITRHEFCYFLLIKSLSTFFHHASFDYFSSQCNTPVLNLRLEYHYKPLESDSTAGKRQRNNYVAPVVIVSFDRSFTIWNLTAPWLIRWSHFVDIPAAPRRIHDKIPFVHRPAAEITCDFGWLKRNLELLEASLKLSMGCTHCKSDRRGFWAVTCETPAGEST